MKSNVPLSRESRTWSWPKFIFIQFAKASCPPTHCRVRERHCHSFGIFEAIVTPAGAGAAWEDTQTVDQLGVRTATNGRLQQQCRIDPDLVRALRDGEAGVAHAGRWAHIRVSLCMGVVLVRGPLDLAPSTSGGQGRQRIANEGAA